MFHARDHSELVDSDELAMSMDYHAGRYEEKLDDAIRLDETRQAMLDGSDPDFWKPLDDWMLD